MMMFPSGKAHIFQRRSSLPVTTTSLWGCTARLQDKREADYIQHQFHFCNIQRWLILDGPNKQQCFLSSQEFKIHAMQMSFCYYWRKQQNVTDVCETRNVSTSSWGSSCLKHSNMFLKAFFECFHKKKKKKRITYKQAQPAWTHYFPRSKELQKVSAHQPAAGGLRKEGQKDSGFFSIVPIGLKSSTTGKLLKW